MVLAGGHSVSSSQPLKRSKPPAIPYTIFYPSTFMETIPYQMMQGKKVGMVGRSEMPMWFIAASDYAKQVARSFETTGQENKEYTIQGTEAFTSDEARRSLLPIIKDRSFQL
jgi:uncharacterized protein YbjT (DUF2867 family)